MQVYMHIAFVLHFWLSQWLAVLGINCTSQRALHLGYRACTLCMYTLHTHSLHHLYITGRITVRYLGTIGKTKDLPPELEESQWHKPPQSYPATFFNSFLYSFIHPYSLLHRQILFPIFVVQSTFWCPLREVARTPRIQSRTSSFFRVDILRIEHRNANQGVIRLDSGQIS